MKGNYLYVGSTDGSKVIKRTAGTLIVGGDLGTDGKMNVNGIPLSNDSNWLSSGTFGYKTTGDISAGNINASNNLRGKYLYVNSTNANQIGGDFAVTGSVKIDDWVRAPVYFYKVFFWEK